MEPGALALITAPSLFALIPLLIYIVLSFKGKNSVSALFISVAVGAVLCGLNLPKLGKLFSDAIAASPMLIGVIIMLGSGLGLLMTETRVTHTMVYWIVKGIGVNTQTKAKIAVIICSISVCGVLGTLGGGNAIIAPIIIPIMASLGVTPTVTMILLMVSGQIGLVIGPTTGVSLMTQQITGMSYVEYLLGAAGPYAIFWLAFTWIGTIFAQKKTEGLESYTITDDMKALDDVVITAQEKRTTLAFLVAFVGLVVYGTIAGAGTNYAAIVIISLAAVITVFSRTSIDKTVGYMVQGVKNNAARVFLYIFFSMMTTIVGIGGGFDALSDIVIGLTAGGGASALMILAAFVGGFGIEAAAIVELQIIADMFMEAAMAVAMPIACFATAMIGATRLTGNLYPASNFINTMGIAQSDNTKECLKGLWWGCAGQVVWIVIYAFVGPMIF